MFFIPSSSNNLREAQTGATKSVMFHSALILINHTPAADITVTLLQNWVKPILPLPALGDLATYIQGPLSEDNKIPLSDHAIMDLVSSQVNPRAMCSLSDVHQLFRSSEEEQADLLWTIVKTALTFPPPDSDSTESAFHGFWDNNIRVLLDVAITGKTIRDSNNQTSTALLRPDFGVLIDGICVFRGEEKALKYSGTHPRNELFQKLTWTYDPAPYVLG
jgi:hypothetical protein